MSKYISIFISSLIAGFCITLGASTYLVCFTQSFGLKVVGAFLFCIGLFTIIHFKFWLFTGKVGFVLNNKPKYFLDLFVCLIGNLLGAFILASLIKVTRMGPTLIEAAKNVVASKQNDSWYSILLLAILCGIMIYIAVVGHEKTEYPLGKTIFAFFPIVLFILLGFEHVVANACYYTYAGVFNAKMVGYFVLMAIGNGIGSIFIDGSIKLINYFKNKETN